MIFTKTSLKWQFYPRPTNKTPFNLKLTSGKSTFEHETRTFALKRKEKLIKPI